MKPTKETIIRTVLLALTIINSFLSLFGKSPLPIDDETVTQLVSLILTTVAAVVAWWKNNSYSQAALEADIVMHMLKKGADKSEKVEQALEEGEQNG